MRIFMKKLSCIVILTMCVLGVMNSNNITANAATTGTGLEYYIRDGEIVISGYAKNIVDVVIPKEIYGYKVTSIDSYAFSYCESLNSVIILSDLDYIGEGAFFSCSELETVELKGAVREIEEDAFGNCKKLKKVTMAIGVEVIERNAFCDCESLVSVNIPNGVIEIQEGVFLNCEKLSSIYIPQSVMYLADKTYDYSPWQIFRGCKNLRSIKVSEKNEYYQSHDGVLYTKDSECYLAYVPEGKTGSYDIPSFILGILEGAFYSSNLSEVTVPYGVMVIGEQCFSGSKIKKVIIPDSVQDIGYYAFYDCDDIVVYCARGSYVLEYVINHDVKFDVDAYIGNFTASIKQDSFAYTGDYIKPVVTVKGMVNGKTVTLTNWKDYKVTYENFRNPGHALITVTGRGKYVGKLQLYFYIRPIDISKFTATIKQSSFAYTGEYIKPVVTVKGTVNGKTVTLENWKNYKVEYKNFKNPGQATMTIAGRGIYGGTKTINFYIRPGQVKNVKYVGKSKTYVNFKWDKSVGVTGYEVYRATSKNGTYTKVGTVSTTSFKNTGLKTGKTYYYKVRAYKTVGSTKLYGAYSGVYTIATK